MEPKIPTERCEQPWVPVLDKHGTPLMPCHPKRARMLLKSKRAVVAHAIPFVIRLVDRVGGDTQPIRLLFDPGSKKTGVAIVREVAPATTSSDPDEDGPVRVVLFKAEIEHRGGVIKGRLARRSELRRGRRARNVRYRPMRYSNRRPPRGVLMPSLRHRVETTMTWANRFMRWYPVTSISVELVCFDVQKLANPEIKGVEYQRGTLYGYELRGYVLAKWNHACAYCGVKDVPLNLDHVIPRAKGGSDRVSNLVAACVPCNQKKDARSLAEFLKSKPDVLKRILAQLKTPLKDASAVNATRRSLHRALAATGLIVETASGGRTKWNRTRLGIPKTHANDAACVGSVSAVFALGMQSLAIKCMGRGSYCRVTVDRFRFPRAHFMRSKHSHGFRTGDIVRAVVPKGRRTGTHVGRAVVRARGYVDICSLTTIARAVSHKHCRVLQRADGYGYGWEAM